MTYKVINEILSTTINKPKSILHYQNITKRKLWFNKFDLISNVHFSRHGIITIMKNGIEIFSNENIKNNPLKKYSQFPIRDKILFLDRDDYLEIIIYDSNIHILDDIEITVSISLDFENLPESSILIPFTLADLSQVSTTVDIFPKKHYPDGFGGKNFSNPIEIEGYKKMIITIITNDNYDPQLLSNIHNSPPLKYYDKLYDSYMGNISNLKKLNILLHRIIGSKIFWKYTNDKFEQGGFQIYDKNGNVLDISEINNKYDSDIAIFDTNNTTLSNIVDYSFILSSSVDFNFEKSFNYLRTISLSWNHVELSRRYSSNGWTFRTKTTRNLDFIFAGYKIFSKTTNKLYVETCDDEIFSKETTSIIKIIHNYNNEKSTLNFSTNKRYIRFRKNTEFEIKIEPHTNSLTNTIIKIIKTKLNNTYPVIESTALIDFINNLPINGKTYLPNRNMGYHNLQDIPTDFPTFVHNFLKNQTNNYDNNSAIFDFEQKSKLPTTDVKVTMGFQILGTNNIWFDIIEDIGKIKSIGKTIIQIDEFTHNSFIIPSGNDSLRSFFTANKHISITATALLT